MNYILENDEFYNVLSLGCTIIVSDDFTILPNVLRNESIKKIAIVANNASNHCILMTFIKKTVNSTLPLQFI